MSATATEVTHFLFEAKPLWTGQIGAGGVADDTVQTIPLQSASNLDSGDVYVVRVNRVDSNGTKTANPSSSTEVLYGKLSGTNLIDSVRGAEGTAQQWDAGTVVEVLFTSTHWNKMIEFLGVSHKATGAMIDSLPLTTPQITTSINDANGNEVIKTPATTSAVNEVTITNSATGNAVAISATGGDTNIDLKLIPKGSGALTVSGTTDYENNVTDADDIPNKAYVDSKTVATDAIFDAKGDLAVGTGANTAAVLTVGANDLVLTADSAQATGLKYGGAMANHTTTFGGFSADPAPSTIRYCQIGKVVFVWYTATSNGTSNGTSLTMTLPKAAARTESIHCMGRGVDNAAILTTPLMVKLTATSATATFYKDQSEGTWNGGAVAKSVNFHFAYEVA